MAACQVPASRLFPLWVAVGDPVRGIDRKKWDSLLTVSGRFATTRVHTTFHPHTLYFIFLSVFAFLFPTEVKNSWVQHVTLHH